MVRLLDVALDDLLDLVNCADTYGFADDVFFDAMASWAGPVTPEEIAAYAARFTAPEFCAAGSGEEEAAEAIRRLNEWRDRYVTPRLAM